MPTTSNANQPTAYDNPGFFGLEVFGTFTGTAVYGETTCAIMTVVVWREPKFDELFYAVDRNWGEGHVPFADCTAVNKLQWLHRRTFDEFKRALNDPWIGARNTALSSMYRNARRRLQRRVGRYLWRQPDN